MDYQYKKYYLNNHYIQWFNDVHNNYMSVFANKQLVYEGIQKTLSFKLDQSTYCIKKNNLFIEDKKIKETSMQINEFQLKTKRGEYHIRFCYDRNRRQSQVLVNKQLIHDTMNKKKIDTFPLSLSYDGQQLNFYTEKIERSILILLKFNSREAIVGSNDLTIQKEIKKVAKRFENISFIHYVSNKKMELIFLPTFLSLIVCVQLFAINRIQLPQIIQYIFIIIALLILFFLLTVASIFITYRKSKKRYLTYS